MSHSRNFGVAEARVGLTILTCLLVVLGYVVLQRLGGTGHTPLVETRPSTAEQVTMKPPHPNEPPQPDVLKPEGESPFPHTSLFPHPRGTQ